MRLLLTIALLAAAQVEGFGSGFGGVPSAEDEPERQCDWQCYLNRYPDVALAFGTNTEAAKFHYEQVGKSQGRDCAISDDDPTCTVAPSYTTPQPASSTTAAAPIPTTTQLATSTTTTEPWHSACPPIDYCDPTSMMCSLKTGCKCDWECYLEKYPFIGSQFGESPDWATFYYENFGQALGHECSCGGMRPIIEIPDGQTVIDCPCGYEIIGPNNEIIGPSTAAPATTIDTSACNWECYCNRYEDLQVMYSCGDDASLEFHYLNFGVPQDRDCTCP